MIFVVLLLFSSVSINEGIQPFQSYEKAGKYLETMHDTACDVAKFHIKDADKALFEKALAFVNSRGNFALQLLEGSQAKEIEPVSFSDLIESCLPFCVMHRRKCKKTIKKYANKAKRLDFQRSYQWKSILVASQVTGASSDENMLDRLYKATIPADRLKSGTDKIVGDHPKPGEETIGLACGMRLLSSSIAANERMRVCETGVSSYGSKQVESHAKPCFDANRAFSIRLDWGDIKYGTAEAEGKKLFQIIGNSVLVLEYGKLSAAARYVCEVFKMMESKQLGFSKSNRTEDVMNYIKGAKLFTEALSQHPIGYLIG